ncbi:MAG TPA: ATP-binding protein [Candidatus Acidoferrales bacterium]|nr:ATP-binding protein [Candidatus Acidoferrales bacterium]
MNPGIKLRLAIFITAIASLLMFIGWTAHNSWARIGELHERLAAMQWKNLQTSDHLQQAILDMNNLVLRYAAYREREDWTNFLAASRELNDWLNDQQLILSLEKERPILDQIKAAYGDYLAAAMALNTRIYTSRVSITRVVEFTDFEKQSKRILNLGFQLAATHQTYLDSFQAQIGKSIDTLQFTLLGSLVLLLAAGGWLAMVIYRDMIAPLQVQLVESRQLAERQEKLASLGVLAAGVAHEIRNPLTAIKAWLYMQQKHLAPGTPEYEDSMLISGEINRLERIVKDFLMFARPSDPELVTVPAEKPLREVQNLMEPELKKSRIQLVLDSVPPAEIRIDPGQIRQVLINLIQNAADSIGKDGTITLRARLDEKRLSDRSVNVVILEVSDTGKGIPPEVGKRLFDPFFTTKESGTGLGLPIAARIVEKHQGALQYQTQAGRGTTFGIILPQA